MSTDMQAIGDLALSQAQTPMGAGKFHSKVITMDAIDQKSKEFEGVFMSQMLQPMFEGLKVDPNFGGGHGEEVMRSFMMQEYGKAMSAHGGLGIASMIKSAMIKAQEAADQRNIPSPSLGAAYVNAQ